MLVGRMKLKLQLICGDTYAIGPGKAELLEAILREGSISGAGRAMGMSYRKTWLLVDEMNRCFHSRVVETLSGGGRERGARVTAFGQLMLEAYHRLAEQAALASTSGAYDTLLEGMRAEPLPRTTQIP